MITRHDLSALTWTLAGHIPFAWRFGLPATPLVQVPARVPGSVQAALREAGHLPDWNVGRQSLACEWVENRHWVYDTRIPDDWIQPNQTCRLRCLGLDYRGWIQVDGADVATFRGSHQPHVFDLTRALQHGGRQLRVAFDLAPRWLGQLGQTSEMTEFKTRFNYTWDWIPRLVQIGISDPIFLDVSDGIALGDVRCVAESGDRLKVWAAEALPAGTRLELSLAGDRGALRTGQYDTADLLRGVTWTELPVERWWPNGHGPQPLYTVTGRLIDTAGTVHDERQWRVGFRTIEWEACRGAPAAADPWVCVVNGKRIFLQGVNWPPVRPNTADVTAQDYRQRLEVYRDIGLNTFRVNGVGILEKEDFYRLCDEFGLLVWQDFPLSSSGIENLPPAEPAAIAEMAAIARSFIARRQHHPSLFLWCGGNELFDLVGRPVTAGHPMIAALAKVAAAEDPSRRFLSTTPSGPHFSAEEKDFGKGEHWDVHGPWIGLGLEKLREYYRRDDALFRSEIYAPGASSVELLERYAGDLRPFPIGAENPFWNRPVTWWVADAEFAAEHGRPPAQLAEYVEWSQRRQAEMLTLAMRACKARFPGIGGVLIWCGHDCFPCPTNTSILDFDGHPKPAALALAGIWRQPENPA